MKGKEKVKKVVKTFEDDLKEKRKLVENLTEEQVKAHVLENWKKTDITKGFMLAYMEKFANSEEEKKWRNETFKEAAYKETTRKHYKKVQLESEEGRVLIDADGKILTKTITFEEEDKTYTKFDIASARTAFLEHFHIKTKKKEAKETVKDEWDTFFGI